MKALSDLSIKIFADGADRQSMFTLYHDPLIKGLTTNPTLMRKAGIKDYEAFAKDILQIVKTKPISFEVLSDDFSEMRMQALKMKSWQQNVYVKIPITNSRGESSLPLIKELIKDGIQINVTAILTLAQVRETVDVLLPSVPSIISVFAGRISDTGRDPIPLMRNCRQLLKSQPRAKLLWASVREVFNIFQAESCGCHIVTVPHDILKKTLKMYGMDLTRLSLETVKMFQDDTVAAGFHITDKRSFTSRPQIASQIVGELTGGI